MKMRRVLTALLALVMVLSAVPFGAMAANSETTPAAEGKLFLDKTATLENDGSYTIHMEAFATGKTTTQTIEKGVPLDIVLVLDQSGSMSNKLGKSTKQEALKTAAKNFVDKVYQNGQKHNVEHRIGITTFAGGNGSNEEEDKKYWYLNTGIYDEKGNFIGYEKANSGTSTHYVKFDGVMDINSTYYVKVGSKYVQLTYNGAADSYVEVTNPDISKKDYYYSSSNGGEFANYGEYTEKTEVAKPTQGSETYYDTNGSQLTWKTITVPGEPTYEAISGKIQWNENKVYYIQFSDNSYHSISEQNGTWVDDEGSKYEVTRNGKKFRWGLTTYQPYTKTDGTPTTKTVLTTSDGNEYTGKVFTHATKTGWNVNGTPVTTLYELQKGAGKWQYKDGKKTVDYDGRQVYIQKTASVFGPALVPVAEGVNGAGSKRPNFDKAINALAAEGPTRTAKGVELGNKIFEANPIPADSDRQRIMIVFTDGEPGWSEYDSKEASAAVAQTKITKDTYGAKVYTIGLYDKEKSEQKTFMENMSSNTKTDKKYYHKVSDAAALDGVFQSIQEDISGSTTNVDLTTDSILRDIMSAEGFELTDKSIVTVSIVSGDASKAADETQIKWGTPVEVLTLKHDPNAADGVTSANKTVVKVAGSDGQNAMTIEASTHTKNPEGKANLHTVDVTGFDYKDQYIAQAHKGSKLVVEITGVKALPTVTTDQNIFTNHEQSGIWAPVTEGGERALKAPFPKRPETYMPSASYVVDYAKPLDLAIANFKMNTVKNIDVDGYDPFTTANTAIDHKYGDVNLAGNKLTYTPTTMKWNGYDTFYVFGTTTDETVTAASANANGNVWSKVNVIPANNVYYEDSFISNKSTGTVGITYTGAWEEIKETDSGKNPGSETSGDNHGWIPVLGNENGDTDGSSHHGTFASGATATFTFTGTGVDIYSRTSGSTGTVIATLRDVNDNNKVILGKSVDTLSASGDYYQIPTLTFHEGRNGAPLPHGTYTVELRVANNGTGRLDYYLDGIRVYNPLQKNDSIVDDAYGPDELNATFMEVRDLLLDANSFVGDSVKANGPVFIDQIKEGQGTEVGTGTTTTVVGTYKDYGPKNEVYLANGQSVTFKVDTSAGNSFQVGLKSPTGNPVTVEYGNLANKASASITHTADMYYDVTAGTDGFITIANKSGALLSVTKLKVTNAAAAVNTAAVFAETDVPTMLTAVQTFNTAPVVPETPVEPPVDPTEPDVDIENPEEKPEQPQKPGIFDILDKIFGGIFDWIRP